jgi:hypothetical protein
MAKFEIWQIQTTRSVAYIEADTLEDAMDEASWNSEKYEFLLEDSDTTYQTSF